MVSKWAGSMVFSRSFMDSWYSLFRRANDFLWWVSWEVTNEASALQIMD